MTSPSGRSVGSVAQLGHIRGHSIGGDTAEPPDGDGLDLSGEDEPEARRTADTEPPGRLFHGQEGQGRVERVPAA